MAAGKLAAAPPYAIFYLLLFPLLEGVEGGLGVGVAGLSGVGLGVGGGCVGLGVGGGGVSRGSGVVILISVVCVFVASIVRLTLTVLAGGGCSPVTYG